MKNTVLTPAIAILAAALILLGLSFGLVGIATEKAQAEHMRILTTVLPDSKNFVVETYTGDDTNIRSVHKADNGFVIETATYGYAGEITMMIGVNNDGKVTGLVVMDMSDTFGLGANALNDHVFLSQFLNSNETFAVGTAGADAFSGATGDSSSEASVYVDAISGATVTSKAVVRCVNSAVAFVTGADAATEATSWGG